MSKTRNQRKRESLEGICGGIIVVSLFFCVCLLLCGFAFKTWATHPAEQPIDGVAYLESIQIEGIE